MTPDDNDMCIMDRNYDPHKVYYGDEVAIDKFSWHFKRKDGLASLGVSEF